MIYSRRAVLSLVCTIPATIRASAFAFATSSSSSRAFGAVGTSTTLFSTESSTRNIVEPSPAMKAAEEARQLALSHGYSDFEAWLTSGGDDRSLIKKTGANKYHIRPQPIAQGAVFRGSCTGNPPTSRGYKAAAELYKTKLLAVKDDQTKLDAALSAIYEDQRARIASLLSLPDDAEVILCPSGSDAEYIPLAIAKALQPSKKIANGVTQLREIGAGSAPAAVGTYFSTHAPLLGELPEGLECLVGLEGIDGQEVSARNKDGSVVDAAAEMKDFADREIKAGNYPIVHGVFGGKTGLRDSDMPASRDGGDTCMGIVDACQGRFTAAELQSWLAQDSVVLFTASKFYQAPPFCAAVIVPGTIAKKLKSSSPPGPAALFGQDGLGAFVTDKELSPCLDGWKSSLKRDDANNIGLALRWEAGLAGMEALSASGSSDEERSASITEWATAVTDMVNNEAFLDPWCVERSIVSIRVSKSGGNGGEWRSMSELRELYRWMSADVSGAVSDATAEEKEALSKPAYIGQPVDVSETHAIVRIALGAESLLSYLNDKDATLAEDRATVSKLAAIGKHFDTLKQSGL
mmetsp:Transcript_29036/g.64423  ORF Transcript_29036/g.64423 Transcript_29036/m.64423 type:complete len:577 (+) Transcript_29036:126-1856(+)